MLVRPNASGRGRTRWDREPTEGADDVPDHVELVPVYMRCRQHDDRFTFDVAECELPDPRVTLPGVDELTTTRSRVIELELE